MFNLCGRKYIWIMWLGCNGFFSNFFAKIGQNGLEVSSPKSKYKYKYDHETFHNLNEKSEEKNGLVVIKQQEN